MTTRRKYSPKPVVVKPNTGETVEIEVRLNRKPIGKHKLKSGENLVICLKGRAVLIQPAESQNKR